MNALAWRSAASLAEHLELVAAEFAAADLFYGHGTDNAWDEAVFLCLSAMQLPLDSSDSVLGQVVSQAHKDTIEHWVNKRILARKPLPYITGVGWFAGKPYQVNEHVLIPRSPLAEVLLAQGRPWLQHTPKHILDLCTGSGCIGIEAAHQFPQVQVDLVDISRPALALAEHNAKAHGVSNRVRCLQSDGFAALMGRCYDLILLNPPYVGAAEMQDMPKEYQHEPELALASGEDGLTLTHRLLREVGQYLNAQGVLFLEVGYSAEVLQASYPDFPFTWLEFAHGGEGVAVLNSDDCRYFQVL